MFNFSEALKFLHQGCLLYRNGWNGADMFIFLVPGSTFKVDSPPLMGIFEEGVEVHYLPHIDMKTADGKIAVWTASQTDILAMDWNLI